MSGVSFLELRGVSKSFGSVTALHPTDLTVREGEFFSVLGPSGSGKTTVLRLIAGFETPDTGVVMLGGADVTSRPPNERDVNTVFQDYALFPHMTVRENVEYGLMVRKVPRDERVSRAGFALASVRLEEMGERRPSQLSGGQRQRVALALALVNEPKLLLLDEPLGALDLKLREEMQVELKAIQRRLGITFVYVTHDQGEALSMSDRIAVFSAGRVEQVGTPVEIYDRPASGFVAGFVGTNNVVTAEVARSLGFTADGDMAYIRPERISLSDSAGRAPAQVEAVQYLGAESRVHTRLTNGVTIIVVGPSQQLAGIEVGSNVWLGAGG
ncbi:MAG: ABC transporter ATP-binding protein [Ilumatobacteraceae bacterium]